MEPSKLDKVPKGIYHNPLLTGGAWCIAIGFSVRALAEALRAAGFRVIALDAFGDQDTRETAKVPQIITGWGANESELSFQPSSWTFYSEIVSSGSAQTPLPVFFGGGCENWSGLLARLEGLPDFKVLGPTASEMQSLRLPSNWRKATNGTGLRFPESFFRSSPDGLKQLPDGVEWLRKRSSSSGGLGVTRQTVAPQTNQQQTANGSSEHPSDCYWQARVSGRVLGVTCLVTQCHSGSKIQFVGATESWSCDDWPAPSEFYYRGSFGPIELSNRSQSQICCFVENLIGQSGINYLGWIQLDLIEDSAGQLWLLEVNPRWTAGMEVLRLSGIANLAGMHAMAHGLEVAQAASTNPEQFTPDQARRTNGEFAKICDPWTSYVGKAIYYASSDITLTPELLPQLHQLIERGYSDVPATQSMGMIVESGQPLLTMVAQSHRLSHLDERAARRAILGKLKQQRERLDQMLR